MKRIPYKNGLPAIILLEMLAVSCNFSGIGKEQKTQPNVLILFSDQHSKEVMGYEGHPDVITPNLDQLASEGVVFDRAYCTTGICAPSRSSFMSGLYSRSLGLLCNSGRTNVMKEVTSLATVFKQNGYSTYAFGKRHTSLAVDDGWDVKKSHLYHESPDSNYVKWVGEQGYAREFAHDWAAEFGRGPTGSVYFDSLIQFADLGTRISELPKEYTMEAYTTMLTNEMIKKHAKSNKAFFCWSTFYRPHQPYTPIKEYMDLYDISDWGTGTKHGDMIKKPESFYEDKSSLPPLLQTIRNGENKVWNLDKAFSDEQIFRNYIGAYYALVTEIDYQVGSILDALEENGLSEETIVIYMSDHGDFVGNHGMIEKAAVGHNVYEDILNIPLIIRYPKKIKAGNRTGELVSIVDIYPTLMELAGLKSHESIYPLQGMSLVDLLVDSKPLGREYIVSESWSQAAIITKNYKLGVWIDPTEYRPGFDFRDWDDMFFIRSEDPLEISNQFNNPEYSDTIEKMKAFYKDFTDRIPDDGKQEIISQYN